ncbi:unnamed protein product [Didymodactylos carnosus]|uniref:OCIA domain-containing protein n=1 Tax=Didymodactylos carnosus TaxID=1234261 RepID=A0A813RW14_9BILA|nr:unnamed protein product [Didymodactylos carnosus]CAF0903159.1 unnamed protein product [Didymodactylos carnosus]CAF3574569.1 unnamed protein product [Didymodactylos carnosus]CAF3683503.1 unnamed protein product [Didymodactylos carnosus]
MSKSDNQTIHPKLPGLTLSTDETKILAECEKESLLYRSIPLGLIGLFGTQLAIQRNILTPKLKYLKLGFGLLTGYILGKISYAPTCKNKILKRIPDSDLARAIRGISPRKSEQNLPNDPNSTAYLAQNDPSKVVIMVPQDSVDINRSRTLLTDNESLMRNRSTSDGRKGTGHVNQYGDLVHNEKLKVRIANCKQYYLNDSTPSTNQFIFNDKQKMKIKQQIFPIKKYHRQIIPDNLLSSHNGKKTSNRRYRQIQHSLMDFTANAIYNKVYQRSLNINASLYKISPQKKVWFTIENGTLFGLPLFEDYVGPFSILFQPHENFLSELDKNMIELQLKFDFQLPSTLYYPSNHLLLGLFNMSSTLYHSSIHNRYLVIRTLSQALNVSEQTLTIHKINGSMIKVYFSYDIYSMSKTNLTQLLKILIDRFYSRRLTLLSSLQLPLIEISIVRTFRYTTTPSTITTIPTTIVKFHSIDYSNPLSVKNINILSSKIKTSTMLITNKTTSRNTLSLLNNLSLPLTIIPLSITIFGLLACSIIGCCLCCKRRSSSSSTLLLSNENQIGPHKQLYHHYYRHKHHRLQNSQQDQRQYISKGIPVVFAEELDERPHESHTPLVMRIEKPPLYEQTTITTTSSSSLPPEYTPISPLTHFVS